MAETQPININLLTMKRITLSLLGLLLVMLTGCVVTSVYPYYTAKDLTYEPALIGAWSDPEAKADHTDAWIFEQLEAQTYKLTVRDGSETNEFDAHLFTMGGQKFLDCFTRQRTAYLTPTHVLLRVKSMAPRLEVQMLDYDWLAEYVKNNPKAIRHAVVPGAQGDQQGDTMITLTADTAELQKFVRRHLDNAAAWAKPILLTKRS